MAPTHESSGPLSWEQLTELAPSDPDRVNGSCNAQALLRLFGATEADVRVTLFRDHHAWCPYCQKVWLWLEEKRIPYRIRKVTMFCYGEKERWFRQLVPSGMLPALQLDGRTITESDDILLALERPFGPLALGMKNPAVLPLRQLERVLFRAWCQWLCSPGLSPDQEVRAAAQFDRVAASVDEALRSTPGPYLLETFSSADVVITPYIERMSASLFYYKGYNLRSRHPAIAAWFAAMETRPSYLGTQSDFHTHAHDLPPQMGGCHAWATPEQQAAQRRVDEGPWPVASPDPETSQPEPEDSALIALARVLKHRQAIAAVNPDAPERFDRALRCALTLLVGSTLSTPPAGSAAGLGYLRDRISVPRDMPLHAARRLRQALGATMLAAEGPKDQLSVLPSQHRRDQDPRPFQRQEPSLEPISR
ncbi:glutathione S-transferase family protein [Synechococcus sp. 1G10]|uniref:glutathione S-transferase family protein n=1 Tax=Synechococcus sp. 1G10 TaxID=2025605 RepID=UPI000B98AC1B|nr:glutathione S-transferase family protein [Synechococcus sp. 1G10]